MVRVGRISVILRSKVRTFRAAETSPKLHVPIRCNLVGPTSSIGPRRRQCSLTMRCVPQLRRRHRRTPLSRGVTSAINPAGRTPRSKMVVHAPTSSNGNHSLPRNHNRSRDLRSRRGSSPHRNRNIKAHRLRHNAIRRRRSNINRNRSARVRLRRVTTIMMAAMAMTITDA